MATRRKNSNGAAPILVKNARIAPVIERPQGHAPKKARDPKPCECGCGEPTKGGTFRPGHDARLKGQLLDRIDAGDEAALDQLLRYPSLYDGDKARERLGSDERKAAAKAEARAATAVT